MKHKSTLLLAACSALLFASCATKMAKDKDAPTSPPTATVTVDGGTAAYWAAGGAGSGTLNFRGQSHDFSITSVGAGGTGAQKVSATGNVYNLTSLSDFPGTYTVVRSGFTIIKGTAHAKLTNDDGVVIYLTAKTTGLASSTGASTVVITLKN